jgi:hypothetical protein
MAKTVNLTVKVDDTDFKQFVQKFNAFSAQIGNLNQQFKNINTTIQKAQTNATVLQQTIHSLTQATKAWGGAVKDVVNLLIKGVMAVGTLASMLATGAGLFGLDRLAQSIMQRRRQAMGMGADYGRMQGIQVAGQTILENPTGLLQSISKGLYGSPEEMQGLAALGVRVGPGAAKDPTQVIGTVLRNMHRQVAGKDPFAAIQVGKAFRGGLAISDEDIIRLSRMSRKELEAEIKRMMDAPKLSDRAQKAWADLAVVFEQAKVNIQNAFGERLKNLTPHLEELSKSVVNLIKALLDSGTVAKILNWVTKQLNKLSDWMKDPKKVKEAIEKVDKTVTELIPILKGLIESMGVFWEILKRVASFFGNLLGYGPGGGFEEPGRGGGPPRPVQPGGPNTWRIPFGTPSTQPPAANPPAATTPPTGDGTQPPATSAPPTDGGTQAPAPATRGDINFPGNFLAGGNQFAGFGGGMMGSSSAFFGGGGGNLAMFGGGSSGGDVSIRGGRRSGMVASIRGGNRIAMFGGATRGRIPGNEMAGFRGNTSVSSAMHVDNRRGLAMLQGPLDVDNWQMNRVSNLVVRNVPGANIHMQTTGMAG